MRKKKKTLILIVESKLAKKIKSYVTSSSDRTFIPPFCPLSIGAFFLG